MFPLSTDRYNRARAPELVLPFDERSNHPQIRSFVDFRAVVRNGRVLQFSAGANSYAIDGPLFLYSFIGLKEEG